MVKEEGRLEHWSDPVLGPLRWDARGQAWAGRLAIYRLYHALELWDWFASIGQTQPLDSLTHDMRELTAS